MSMTYTINSPTPVTGSFSSTTTTPGEYAMSLTNLEVSSSACQHSSSWPGSSAGWVYFNSCCQSSQYSTTITFSNTTSANPLNVYLFAVAQGGLGGAMGSGGNGYQNTDMSACGGGGGGGGEVWCPYGAPFVIYAGDYIETTLYPNGNSSTVNIVLHQPSSPVHTQIGGSSQPTHVSLATLNPGTNGSKAGPVGGGPLIGGVGGNGGTGGTSSLTTTDTNGVIAAGYLLGGCGGGGGAGNTDPSPTVLGGTGGNFSIPPGNGTYGTSGSLGHGGGGGSTQVAFANGGYEYYGGCNTSKSLPSGTNYTTLPIGGAGGNMGYNGVAGFPASFMVYYNLSANGLA